VKQSREKAKVMRKNEIYVTLQIRKYKNAQCYVFATTLFFFRILLCLNGITYSPHIGYFGNINKVTRRFYEVSGSCGTQHTSYSPWNPLATFASAILVSICTSFLHTRVFVNFYLGHLKKDTLCSRDRSQAILDWGFPSSDTLVWRTVNA
jgi:hypothetical protein